MRKFIEPSIAICPMRSPRLASSSKRFTTKRVCTRLSAMFRRSSSRRMAGLLNEGASPHSYLGALPPNPRNFSLSARMDLFWGAGCARSRPIPAAESVLGLRSRSALSPAQVFPEWTTSTSPCNNFLSNGDTALNSLSHSKGSLQSIEEFERDLKKNLYKIWNRMSSGSYFPPPVRTVKIPKANGGERTLGIPTVSDRIAQMVVKKRFEAEVDPLFLSASYGYRPNKSA